MCTRFAYRVGSRTSRDALMSPLKKNEEGGANVILDDDEEGTEWMCRDVRSGCKRRVKSIVVNGVYDARKFDVRRSYNVTQFSKREDVTIFQTPGF